MKPSTVLITLGVVGVGALAFATISAAQLKSTPANVKPLPMGSGSYDVVKGNAYQLLIQPTGPAPNMDVLASDLIGQGWAVYPGLRASVTTPGGMLTVPAIWAGPTGKVSGQPSIRMSILNMSLSPNSSFVQKAMQTQPSAWTPGLLPPDVVMPAQSSASSGRHWRGQAAYYPYVYPDYFPGYFYGHHGHRGHHH